MKVSETNRESLRLTNEIQKLQHELLLVNQRATKYKEEGKFDGYTEACRMKNSLTLAIMDKTKELDNLY